MGIVPKIKMAEGQKRLLVDGKPYIIYGGEIHNSSASSPAYMEKNVWPALRRLEVNTVLLPVYWETIEPRQGAFDFTLPDALIQQARDAGIHLVFLWFGLWKNAQSTYVPAWVKKDYKRYFRVRNEAGMPLKNISPLCEEAVTADANAFAAWMRHLKEVDEKHHTVLMVQVENEIGVLGAARDFSPAAQTEYSRPVPPDIAERYWADGNWEAVFKDDAPEYFMGYHYARAVEKIASAGKKEYPLPLYVNAWLEQFPEIPGKYPCGGPIFRLVDLWKHTAPSVDFYAPDIYVDHYRDVCDEYAAEGNPFFIPEVRNSIDCVSFLLYAVGKENFIGFSPFGIEDLYAGNAQETDAEVLRVLNIGQSALRAGEDTGNMLAHTYRMLKNMDEVLVRAQNRKKIVSFLEQNDDGRIISLRDADLIITYNGHGSVFNAAPGKIPGAPAAGGFVIEEGEFVYLVGTGYTAEFLPKKGRRETVEVIQKEEGCFTDNIWIPNRILNGDEGYFIRLGTVPEIQKIQIHTVSYEQ